MAARIGTATITSSATTCTPGTIAGVYRPAGGGATKVAGGPSSARALRALRASDAPRPRRPARALSRSASRWGLQCSRATRAARSRCPQTPSAGSSALALGLPLGAPVLARYARCALPMPPDPVGRLERSRARPPAGARPVLARYARCVQTPARREPRAPDPVGAAPPRAARALARSSAVSGGDDRPLGPEPEGRAPEVDEALLVLEQLVGGRLGLGGGERRLQILAAVPPELRHAVVGLLRAAALAQDGVERVVHGV